MATKKKEPATAPAGMSPSHKMAGPRRSWLPIAFLLFGACCAVLGYALCLTTVSLSSERVELEAERAELLQVVRGEWLKGEESKDFKAARQHKRMYEAAVAYTERCKLYQEHGLTVAAAEEEVIHQVGLPVDPPLHMNHLPPAERRSPTEDAPVGVAALPYTKDGRLRHDPSAEVWKFDPVLLGAAGDAARPDHPDVARSSDSPVHKN